MPWQINRGCVLVGKTQYSLTFSCNFISLQNKYMISIWMAILEENIVIMNIVGKCVGGGGYI